MQSKIERIVVAGDSPIAEVAFEYFTHDSPYEVAAFTVDKDFMKNDTLFDRPIVPFETVEEQYSPREHKMFVAVGYTKLNRLRARFFEQAKAKGYSLVSYVSSQAFVWRNVEIGENCFIFEHNVIQPFVRIGNNVTLWSGNHIGHHTTIRDHCFIASHVVVSGFVEIGEYTFVGVNATFADTVKVGKNSVIGAGAIILKDTEEAKVYGTKMTTPRDLDTLSPAARKMFWPGEGAL